MGMDMDTGRAYTYPRYAHARAMFLSPRPHEKRSLADIGHKQFWWAYKEKDRCQAIKKRKIETKAKQDLDAEEYGETLKMIEREPPVAAIGGRRDPGQASIEDAKVDKKQLRDKQRQEKDAKRDAATAAEAQRIASLTPAERAKHNEQVAVEEYKTHLKTKQDNLVSSIQRCNLAQGRLATKKGSSTGFTNMSKLVKSVKERGVAMKLCLDKISYTIGAYESVDPKCYKTPKFQAPLTEAMPRTRARGMRAFAMMMGMMTAMIGMVTVMMGMMTTATREWE